MIFFVTDFELVSAIQSATRGDDGRLAVCFPSGRLQDDDHRPALTFNPAARTVQSNGSIARLSPTQFALLYHVYTHGRTNFETLQDEVWKAPTSDGAIRAAVANTNARLMDSGFRVELAAQRSRVSLDAIE